MHDETWMQRAACQGLDVELFYSTNDADVREAVRVCRSCPVRMECLQAAMSTAEIFGVWGGMHEGHRRRIIRREQRQRRSDAA